MTSAQSTEVSVANKQPAYGKRILVARAFRWSLIALVFAVGCSLAYGFGKFWAELKLARQPVIAVQSDATDLNPMTAALPLAGPWSFDELDWNLRSEVVEKNKLEALFNSLAASQSAATDAQLPDTDPKIINLITALNVRPTEEFGNKIFRLERSDLKAQLVARHVAGQTKTVTFAIAYPQNGAAWQLYEFVPKPAGANTGADAHPDSPHLLPLPAAARRNGGRFADDGKVLLELISLDGTSEKLLAMWKAAGWEVRPSGLTSPEDFSFLCARGTEVVYAWSADPADSLKNLMLVRTANPSDTKP